MLRLPLYFFFVYHFTFSSFTTLPFPPLLLSVIVKAYKISKVFGVMFVRRSRLTSQTSLILCCFFFFLTTLRWCRGVRRTLKGVTECCNISFHAEAFSSWLQSIRNASHREFRHTVVDFKCGPVNTYIVPSLFWLVVVFDQGGFGCRISRTPSLGFTLVCLFVF